MHRSFENQAVSIKTPQERLAQQALSGFKLYVYIFTHFYSYMYGEHSMRRCYYSDQSHIDTRATNHPQKCTIIWQNEVVSIEGLTSTTF